MINIVSHYQLELAERKIAALSAQRDELLAFAERHGWRTADGGWVAGHDRVYYCTCEQSPTTPREVRLPFAPFHVGNTADNIQPGARRYWFSTKEAAEAYARREWEQ